MSHKSVLQECHLDICSFLNVFAFGFVGSILFLFLLVVCESIPEELVRAVWESVRGACVVSFGRLFD